MENKYADTKIYKLECPDGFYYYGHTTNTLSYRKGGHKSDSKKSRNSNSPLYKHIENCKIDWKDIKMILIENYPCNSKDEARAKENEYIVKFKNNIKCLNYHHSFLSKEAEVEYRNEYNKKKGVENQQRYREANQEKVKAYYEANKQKMLLRNAEIIPCPICSKELRRDSMSKHKKSQHPK
jgi:hypothetical protein